MWGTASQSRTARPWWRATACTVQEGGGEFIPESIEAMQERDAVMQDDELLERLGEISSEVQDLVPDCIGISVAFLEDEMAVTMVATDPEIAVLDALQYLGDGPCVQAVRD